MKWEPKKASYIALTGMGKSKLFSFSAFCITFAKPNLEWVIWIWNVFSIQFASFLHLDHQILCITSERCREGPSLGCFPDIFNFWFLSSATFLFCWELLHSVCTSVDSSGNRSGQMANVSWHSLERKGLITLTCILFSYLWGWNCTISAPV